MWLPIVCVILAMIFVQSGAALAKQLFPLVGAAGTITLRLIFSALFVNLYFKNWKHKFNQKNWHILFLYGASLGLMNLLFYFAIERIPLGLAVAFEFTGPLVVALISFRKRSDFCWIIMAALGLLFLTPLFKISTDIDPIGIMFALGAGVFWGFYIIFGKKISQHMSSGQTVAYGLIFAALVASPLGLFTAGTHLLEQNTLLLGAAVALLSSALPYSLEMIALQRLPKTVFSILMSLEPAFATVSGFLFLNEKLRFLQVVGIICVVAASVGITYQRIQGNESELL